jgi:hypothetical protein
MMVDAKAGISGRHQLNRDVSSALLYQLNYTIQPIYHMVTNVWCGAAAWLKLLFPADTSTFQSGHQDSNRLG